MSADVLLAVWWPTVSDVAILKVHSLQNWYCCFTCKGNKERKCQADPWVRHWRIVCHGRNSKDLAFFTLYQELHTIQTVGHKSVSFITNVPDEVRIAVQPTDRNQMLKAGNLWDLHFMHVISQRSLDVYPVLLSGFMFSLLLLSFIRIFPPLIAGVMALGTGKLRKGDKGLRKACVCQRRHH